MENIATEAVLAVSIDEAAEEHADAEVKRGGISICNRRGFCDLT